ncbi:MAG: aminotransferase class V-fold PLP-dependent enzyme [Planctomycetota bacterium]|nr:aminotransferase class V-fold PLP-dependent enzyme [Planctomycetota bacterium]
MLWIPGPTEVRPEILAEMAQPMVGHRGPEMTELIKRIDPHLKLAFGLWDDTRARYAVGTHSATAMMEGALLGTGERILCIVGGAFAKRWLGIARTLGKQAVALEVEWGRAVTDEELARALDEKGPFDAVTLVVNETSTGVHTPIATVSNVLQAFPDTLLLVDVVSYLAGAPLDFDASCVDFALAGVNKALALPPGITVFCASEAYCNRAASVERRSWYLDPLRTLKGHEGRKTPTTPSIPHYRALARQLEDITGGVTLPEGERKKRGAEAWRARFDKHERMRARTLAWAADHGLEPLPPRELCSPTVSCIRAGSLDVAAFVAGLKERGFEISNGYGPLKGETFRIGHMGDHSEEGLEELLAAADEVLGAPARS